MTDEAKKDITLVTLDPEELNDVAKRVHAFLLKRAEKAKGKKLLKPTDKSEQNHIEAAKDVFVFVHMMELIEHMSEEISDLRDVLDALEGNSKPNVVSSFDMFSTNKKNFIN